MKPWRTSITVNKPLWLRFKATLALEEKDMSAVIEALVDRYLREHEEAAQAAARLPAEASR
jgi:hypothetical protein